MIGDKSVLAIVVARGGSKGLPRKNVLDLGGKPLVAWSVAAGREARLVDRLILSSDDAEIIDAARRYGCDIPFVRPAALAGDASPVEDALIHALDNVGRSYDYLVLLQATSPLRSAADIDGAVTACHEAGANSCISVVEAEKSPHMALRQTADGRLVPLFDEFYRRGHGRRRQDMETFYMPNGAVYVARASWFRESLDFYSAGSIGYVMPKERSIDIDTRRDLTIAEIMLKTGASNV